MSKNLEEMCFHLLYSYDKDSGHHNIFILLLQPTTSDMPVKILNSEPTKGQKRREGKAHADVISVSPLRYLTKLTRNRCNDNKN